jgi:5-methylcytosine-specific restriction endonuclease McrA
VREQGIPLETFRISNSQGKSIGAYRFADPSKIRSGTLSGRKVFPKEFKQSLVQDRGCKCGVCVTEYEARYLQVDHRVPYEVGGEGSAKSSPNDFQLLCGSCNRAKSWSCEHCANWISDKKVKVCLSCYWANPEDYRHVALRPIRRLDVTWTGDETREFDQLAKKHGNKSSLSRNSSRLFCASMVWANNICPILFTSQGGIPPFGSEMIRCWFLRAIGAKSPTHAEAWA